MAEAQQAMAAIAVEQQKYNTAKMRIDQQAKAQAQVQPQAQQPQAQQPQAQRKHSRSKSTTMG